MFAFSVGGQRVCVQVIVMEAVKGSGFYENENTSTGMETVPFISELTLSYSD